MATTTMATTTMATTVTFIDNEKDLKALLNTIVATAFYEDNGVPHLYLRGNPVEGGKVWKKDPLPLLTILIFPHMTLYIIDLTFLGQTAFSTKDGTGTHDVKSILESEKIVKVCWDVRWDSLLIHRRFGIRLAGINDLQLMQIASSDPKSRVTTLGHIVHSVERLSDATGNAIRERGYQLCGPKQGDAHAVFDARPLSEDIKKFCIQDMQYMPKLWEMYHGKTSELWWNEMLKETKKRIELTQTTGWKPPDRAPFREMGPLDWEFWDRSKLGETSSVGSQIDTTSIVPRYQFFP